MEASIMQMFSEPGSSSLSSSLGSSEKPSSSSSSSSLLVLSEQHLTPLSMGLPQPLANNARVLMNGTLFIQRVREEDEGLVMCEAANGVGDDLVASAALTIHAPPKFVVDHAGPVTGRKGEPIELVCEATGDGHITIVWQKDGRVYRTRSGHSSTTEIRDVARVTSRLVIVEATHQDDAGRYVCRAENDYGRAHFTIDVSVWESPPTPGNVTLLDVGSREARVGWTLEHASPRVERVVLQWRRRGESEWQPTSRLSVVAGSANEALVSGLTPWTIYQLRVMAENQLGRSREPSIVQFVTGAERPGGAPRSVRLTAVSSTKLEVTWEDPEPLLRHGPITHYVLGFRARGEKEFKFLESVKHDVRLESHQIVLSRLLKFTEYEVVVQAVNDEGEGPLSKPCTGRTNEDRPSAAPSGTRCAALSSTSIQFSWRPPDQDQRNGVIKGYKVLYAPQPRTEPMSHLPLPKISRLSTLTTVLENLDKFSNYSLQVMAFTAAGDGKLSPLSFCKTHSDVPGPPAQVKALVRSESSVTVSWMAAEQSNGLVQRYHVYARGLSMSSRAHLKFSHPSLSRWSTVTDLMSDEAYQFWVTAVTDAGEGMSSTVITQTPTRHQIAARVVAWGGRIFVRELDVLSLSCEAVGGAPMRREWFFRGQPMSTTSSSTTTIELSHVTSRDEGNYTCLVENTFGTDTISHHVSLQRPPSAPEVRVLQTLATSILIGWQVLDDGHSPIQFASISHKDVYGDWNHEVVSWHTHEFRLDELLCGHEYHVYVVAANAIAASSMSDVVTIRTKGGRPKAPDDSDAFVRPNISNVDLRLYLWKANSCDIVNFVIEYRLASAGRWITVTNNLMPQDWFRIRGLSPGTRYHLRVTAHSHAGHASQKYTTTTLSEVLSDAARARDAQAGSLLVSRLLRRLGVRSSLLILVSSICLILASFGLCLCLRRNNVGSSDGRGYGAVPKSNDAVCEGQDVQLVEQRRRGGGQVVGQVVGHHGPVVAGQHQVYATIQRKQPPVPPFGAKGFSETSERLLVTTSAPASTVVRFTAHLSEQGQSNELIAPYAVARRDA